MLKIACFLCRFGVRLKQESGHLKERSRWHQSSRQHRLTIGVTMVTYFLYVFVVGVTSLCIEHVYTHTCTCLFYSIQFFRLERHHAGLLYRPSLFHRCGSIYVSKDTSPAPQELEHLLHLSGAKVFRSILATTLLHCYFSSQVLSVRLMYVLVVVKLWARMLLLYLNSG